jgi:hypothetical protein
MTTHKTARLAILLTFFLNAEPALLGQDSPSRRDQAQSTRVPASRMTKKPKPCVLECVSLEGRIPIDKPTTITSPGSYVLVRNIGDLTTPAPIKIQVNNVDLDLNGFTVSALEPAIQAQNVSHVSIHDGFLLSSEDAIAFTQITGFVIENLTIKGLEDCIVAVSGSLGVIRNNRIEGAGNGALCVSGSGIKIHSNALGDKLSVQCTGCSIVENELVGVAQISGAFNIVKDNAGIP